MSSSPKPSGPPVAAMAHFWQTNLKKTPGQFQRHLTGKDYGQLKHLRNSLGDETMEVLGWVLTN